MVRSLKNRWQSNDFFYLLNHFIKRWFQTGHSYIEDLRWKNKWNGRAPYAEDEIPGILKSRRKSTHFKPKGSLKILHVGYGQKVATEKGPMVLDRYASENLLPALKAFGEVKEFSVEFPEDIHSPSWLTKRREINQSLAKCVDTTWVPDVLIGQMWGWFIDPRTLEEIRNKGVIVVNYSWDDTAQFYGEGKIDGVWSGTAGLAVAVDLNLTASKRSCLKYQAEGGVALLWPEAANPEIHRPYEVPFEHDVSFVGVRYGYRPLLIDFLRKHGVQVAAFGPGWDGGVLPAKEMVVLYSRSRINLGFGGIGHMFRVQHIKGRDFEIPMSGGLYLTSYHPELEDCYKIGEEIVCYKDKWDCLKKIKYLLEHPDQAQTIRKAGHERALREHTWERRLEKLFGILGLME